MSASKFGSGLSDLLETSPFLQVGHSLLPLPRAVITQSAQKLCKHSLQSWWSSTHPNKLGTFGHCGDLEVKPQCPGHPLLPPEVLAVIPISWVPIFCLLVEFCFSTQPQRSRLLSQPWTHWPWPDSDSCMSHRKMAWNESPCYSWWLKSRKS